MKPSLFWSMMVKACRRCAYCYMQGLQHTEYDTFDRALTSLNSWIWACSNMENTLEPPPSDLFLAFLGACRGYGGGGTGDDDALIRFNTNGAIITWLFCSGFTHYRFFFTAARARSRSRLRGPMIRKRTTCRAQLIAPRVIGPPRGARVIIGRINQHCQFVMEIFTQASNSARMPV